MANHCKRVMNGRSVLAVLVALMGMALISVPAHAAFHLWTIDEVYSNASGTVQFIELVDPSGGGNQFTSGTQIHVSNVGNTQTNTFTMPSNTGAPTAGHHLLLGTAGLQAAGGPAPDFTIPDNFLFTGGGNISFFGANSGAYTALPTDGLQSLVWGTTNDALNSPTNFAGQIGQLPEPATVALFTCCGICLLRRRKIIG